SWCSRSCSQPLSASRIFVVPVTDEYHHERKVLNAFRHHGVLRRLPLMCMTDRLIVLNAFRHHGVLRWFWLYCLFFVHGVLNAFRHHGVLRQTCRRLGPHESRAQRLSASRSFAGGRVGHGGHGGHVLNAFRHHGVLRPCPIVTVFQLPLCSTP